MKKLITIFILLMISLTGCTGLIGDGSDRFIATWEKDGDPSYKIRFQEDNTGIALSQNTNDYLFDWRIDSDSDNVMYWEMESGTTRMVYYYFLHEDDLLVLMWDGNPTVYERSS